MKIAGSGTISAGDYNEEISVCGSGKISGNICCPEFKCSGAVKSIGDIVCEGEAKISGTMRTEGNFKAGSLKISGSCAADKSVAVKDGIVLSGNLKVGENLKCAEISVGGGLTVGADIEAENIKIEGTVQCGGLMNAEKIEIRLEHSENKISSMGGSEISVYPGKTSFVNKVPLLSKIVGCKVGVLEVEESIEGDSVSITSVRCPSVVGRVVKIGADCEIDVVKYSEEVTVDPEAKVGKCEKI